MKVVSVVAVMRVRLIMVLMVKRVRVGAVFVDKGNASGGRIDGYESGNTSSSGDGDKIAGGNDSEDEATLISKLAVEIAYNLVNVSFNQLCK